MNPARTLNEKRRGATSTRSAPTTAAAGTRRRTGGAPFNSAVEEDPGRRPARAASPSRARETPTSTWQRASLARVMAGQPPRCLLKVARLALRPDLLGVGLDRVYGCVAAIAALGRRRKTPSIGSGGGSRSACDERGPMRVVAAVTVSMGRRLASGRRQPLWQMERYGRPGSASCHSRAVSSRPATRQACRFHACRRRCPSGRRDPGRRRRSRCAPSGVRAAETNVSGSTTSGDPIGFWLATSHSRTVPSCAGGGERAAVAGEAQRDHAALVPLERAARPASSLRSTTAARLPSKWPVASEPAVGRERHRTRLVIRRRSRATSRPVCASRTSVPCRRRRGGEQPAVGAERQRGDEVSVRSAESAPA